MVMKSVCVLACLVLAGAAANEEGHPISKVIKMLDGLKMKSIAEGKGEAVLYQKFAYWCSESTTTLKDALAEEKETISELEDLLAGKKKEKETLEKEIDALKQQIGDMEAAGLKAKNLREKEENLYTKALSDTKMTIQAVDDALAAMTGANKATEPGMLLAQKHVKKVLALVSLSLVTSDVELGALQSFADPKDRPTQKAAGDLDAHVDKYEFKSGNVVELLKNLKHKFQDDKLALTKDETNAVNAYNLAKQARDTAMAAAKASQKKKETTLGKVDATITQTEKDLKDQNENKDADTKSLNDLTEQCATKKGEYDTRSEVRSQELVAMDMAMKILSKASGVRTEAPGNPVPPPSPAMFLQIVAGSSNPKMAAVLVLREAAQKTHSHALERLAVEVTAHLTGPFDQVNNMIQKMQFRLMDEQKQEDEHKAWCDQELEKTNVMKDDKTDKIKNLNAELDVEKAEISELTEQIKAANKMISDIVSFKKEATEIRAVGKKENKLAVDDAETAQKAVADAIAVLETFYKDSGMVKKEAWEFVQKPGVELPKNPATWDSSYTGVSDPKKQPNGIIAVLEGVMEDFAKLEADTKSQETTDQKAFDQSMSDNDIEMARRTQEADMKSDEKKRRNEQVTHLQSQKKDTSSELEKTEQYLTDLKPACVDGDSSYGDRKTARSQEIEALKKAQVILEDAFKEKAKVFLQIRRH